METTLIVKMKTIEEIAEWIDNFTWDYKDGFIKGTPKKMRIMITDKSLESQGRLSIFTMEKEEHKHNWVGVDMSPNGYMMSCSRCNEFKLLDKVIKERD